MEPKLTFEYDKIGDILYIFKVPPYAEQESDELEDYVVARMNPETGDVEGLEILFWSKRFDDRKLLELPLTADLRIAG
jgi:hypothetical protein